MIKQKLKIEGIPAILWGGDNGMTLVLSLVAWVRILVCLLIIISHLDNVCFFLRC
ncbi:hypothetical protein J2W97_005076 [Paenibacillus jamilae]|jgi:hypothetical protein|nr:hypothetical protein [Paenibacillus jamilae]